VVSGCVVGFSNAGEYSESSISNEHGQKQVGFPKVTTGKPKVTVIEINGIEKTKS
jgi:hypothetical protein